MAEFHGMGRPLMVVGDCRLYADRGSHAVNSKGVRNVFWGVRSVIGGGYENQRFSGTRKDVERKFEEWAKQRPRVLGKEEKLDKKPEQAREQACEQYVCKPTKPQLPETLYALAYKRGTTVRYVMAFADLDAATDAADVAGKALEVAGVDGEYTIDELQVRW